MGIAHILRTIITSQRTRLLPWTRAITKIFPGVKRGVSPIIEGVDRVARAGCPLRPFLFLSFRPLSWVVKGVGCFLQLGSWPAFLYNRDTTGSYKSRPVGLLLSVCNKIAQEHHKEQDHTSSCQGHGSTFSTRRILNWLSTNSCCLAMDATYTGTVSCGQCSHLSAAQVVPRQRRPRLRSRSQTSEARAVVGLWQRPSGLAHCLTPCAGPGRRSRRCTAGQTRGLTRRLTRSHSQSWPGKPARQTVWHDGIQSA
ncbi:hypothetical protein F4778DRAFT_629057 [Xylariomycetidae sp. FL2044]|nr:hypothetical protein F4778DRAFT_629057 [Xylariomycetidae sp. FL2044]